MRYWQGLEHPGCFGEQRLFDDELVYRFPKEQQPGGDSQHHLLAIAGLLASSR